MEYRIAYRRRDKPESPYCFLFAYYYQGSSDKEEVDQHFRQLERHNYKLTWEYIVLAYTTEVASETDPVDR